MPKQMLFVAALLLLANCTKIAVAGSETEAARCQVWGESLPTRSRQDTVQTQNEIDAAYTVFEVTCPEWAFLIPGAA